MDILKDAWNYVTAPAKGLYNLVTDPFGNDARAKGVSNANNAIQQAANEFDLRTGSIDYNVGPEKINQYMSPDVAFRQNAATQALAQLYGNSGALRSTAAQSGIMNANASIAAQAWNDAFNRASGIQAQQNALELARAQNMQAAQQGVASNNVAQAMSNQGLLTSISNIIGGLGKGISAILG